MVSIAVAMKFTRNLIRAGKPIARREIGGILEKATWNAHDLVDVSAPLRNPPTWETIVKISRLAALSTPEKHFLDDLKSQLRFIEVLSQVDTSEVKPLSRLIPVRDAPENLVDAAKVQAAGDKFEEWQPTSIASGNRGEYYVVREGLHHESPN